MNKKAIAIFFCLGGLLLLGFVMFYLTVLNKPLLINCFPMYMTKEERSQLEHNWREGLSQIDKMRYKISGTLCSSL